MRLNRFQIDTINELARKHFGQAATVYLFGSRTDNKKKGGDIDLLIKNNNEEPLTVEAKVHFLAELKLAIGDRKIDVIFDTIHTRENINFYRSVIRNKTAL